MKDILMRMLEGLLLIIIVLEILYIAIDFFGKEKMYQYMTITGEWGESSNCQIDENQYAYCFEGYELIQVRQFYEL